MLSRRKVRLLVVAVPLFLAIGCGTLPSTSDPAALAQSLLSDASVSAILNGPAAITTSFADTHLDTTLPANFGNDLTPQSLSQQPRNSTGAYLLAPGFYEMTSRSYCLHAGIYGPSDGDGYLYAPLAGERTDVIEALIRNSDAKPDVPQSTVQLLIWAVLAKAKFQDLPANLEVAAVELLTPEQLFELNGGALALIPEDVIDKAVAALPAPIQEGFTAENKLRNLFSQAAVAYSDAESLAVLPGRAAGAAIYPSGGWSKVPAGYFVRYFPSGYTMTRVQVYVPDTGSTAVREGPKGGQAQFASLTTSIVLSIFDAVGGVATPADTSAQRLAQSNSPVGGPPPPPPLPPKQPPTVEMKLLNGQTPDFDGGVPVKITDPDLSPDNTQAALFVLSNAGVDILGVELPLGTGRSFRPGAYVYSLMVIGKVTFPAGTTPAPQSQITCTWNRVYENRILTITRSTSPSQWNVQSLNKQIQVQTGFPVPAADVTTVGGSPSGFNPLLSNKYVVYAYDNPGLDVLWGSACKVGDYALVENAFTYTLNVQAPGVPNVQQTLVVGQQVLAKRRATTGVPITDWTPVSNVVSTSNPPDCSMPNDPAHVAIIRAIVGGNVPIAIDPHANDPD